VVTIIEYLQKAYRKYHQRKQNDMPSGNVVNIMVQAIVKNINKKIVNDVIKRADIPAEFDNRENLMEVGDKLQRTINNKLTRVHIAEEGIASFIVFVFVL